MAEPRVEITFSWGVTDGSMPDKVMAAWQGVMPSVDEVCMVVRELAATNRRYTLAEIEEMDRAAGVLDQLAEPALPQRPTDMCRRPSCLHPRMHHPRNGPCSICEESAPLCPSFLDVSLAAVQ